MAQVITLAGERLFALKAQNNQQLDIDTFIFAYVPGQDSTAQIDRNEDLPPVNQRVHTQIVQQYGMLNDNAVVYSSVLDSLTGPFQFNWVGLYSAVNQTLVAIQHIPTVVKTVTEPGASGNILNRNFVIEYSGIAELTGITVDPTTWQYDFNARLNGMDELTRQLAADMNGKDWFIDDGFKVEPRSTLNTFKVTAGAGYVSGLRVELAADHIITLSSYPQFVYVDAWFDGTSESVWKGHTAFTVTNTDMDDYIDVNGRNHYVFKLARITAADVVEDLRSVDGLAQQIKDVSKEKYKLSSTKKTRVYAPEKAMFAFHFDGPYISNLTSLLDKADELGVKVCIGSIIELTNGAYGGVKENASYGYVHQLIDAAKRGHEIYNHGLSGSLNLSPETDVPDDIQEQWINYSHNWLQKLGINAQCWVTSNGKPVINQTAHLDPKYIPKILEKHSVVFGRTSSPWNDANGFMGSSFGEDTPVNEEGLTRANIEGSTKAQIESFIDWCIDNNRVAVFHAHDSGNANQLSVEKFEETVNYILAKGYEVTTSQDVFASFTNLFSDNGTSAKAANNTALKSSSVVEENLLTSTDLTTWLPIVDVGFGGYNLSNISSSRVEGEQFLLSVSDPSELNKTINFDLILNRPFNTQDIESLTLTIGFSSSNIADFGVQCLLSFFDEVDGGGNLINYFGQGGKQSLATMNQNMMLIAPNLFTYNTCQSVRIRFEIANKTLWTGTKTLNLFNPRLNRGAGAAVFKRKRQSSSLNETIAWRGYQTSGVVTLSKPVDQSHFIKVLVGVNNTMHDVRGSEIYVYNTQDNRTIRAWSAGGSIYTDFKVRFNSPTELEILSKSVVGGGDFAVIGVDYY